MSGLLSPPHPSPRGKENMSPRRTVEWASDSIHLFSPGTPRAEKPTAIKKRQPMKSCLKPTRPQQPVLAEKTRDITPLPENPMTNANYLKWPVSTILAADTTLRELTEAYSILTARIRESLATLRTLPSKMAKTRPVFYPIKQNAELIVAAVIRDLARALQDPLTSDGAPKGSLEEPCPFLPTPRESPKRQGMSEDEVRYARDLCNVSHATMRFLLAAFAIDAVTVLFSFEQLHTMLTQVMAIALAPSLPTPNARKTFGLVIMLLQSQRLPFQVLIPAKDRIVYAIRRGIEGELGKEGKKGPTSDGLRAVHDMSRYQPELFIQGFAGILPSILDTLLAPTLAIRGQAAHAIGGLALGLSAPELNEQHAEVQKQISDDVVAFLTTPSASPKKGSSPASPSTPSSSVDFSQIVKVLRATLKNEEPAHQVQGPVWALSVLSSFIVLIGPALLTNFKVFKVVNALLQLGLRHKKSSIRALATAVWNPLIWVWHRWGAVKDLNVDETNAKTQKEIRELYWSLINSNLFYRTGASIVGVTLGGNKICTDEELKSALSTLTAMVDAGGEKADCAIRVLSRLVMPMSDALQILPNMFHHTWPAGFGIKLLPPALFSCSPGLLTSEWRSMTGVVSKVLAQCPDFEDLRPLRPDELAKPWLWHGLMQVWKEGVSCLQVDGNEGTPRVILDAWEGLVKAKVSILQDDDAGLTEFAANCAETLTGILGNKDIDLGVSPSKSAASSSTTSAPVRSSSAVKLAFVRDLWTILPATIPSKEHMRRALTSMLMYLLWNEPLLVASSQADCPARSEWAQLCAHCALHSQGELPRSFWRPTGNHTWGWTVEQRSFVWRTYAGYWREAQGTWAGAATILGLPFDDRDAWDMSDSDLSEWDALLQYAIACGHQDGIPCVDVMEKVAENIERRHLITLSSTIQIADLLVSHLDIATESHLPVCLVDVVHEILVSTYPPEPRNKMVSLWLLRSLQTLLDNCPCTLIVSLLEMMRDGLCSWLTDEYQIFSSDEHTSDIIPLYQTILVALQALPPCIDVLETCSPIFPTVLFRDSSHEQEALDSFREFFETHCMPVAEPECGWPEGLSIALEQLRKHQGFLPPLAAAIDDHSSYDADVSFESCSEERTILPEDDQPLEYPDSDNDTLRVKRSRTEGFLVAPTSTVDASVGIIDPVLLATPKKNLVNVSPPRPERTSAGQVTLVKLMPPSSPLADLFSRPSGKRRVRALSSATAKRESYEKENIAPECIPLPPSPTPQRSARELLGKRKAQVEANVHEKTRKKHKLAKSKLMPTPLSPWNGREPNSDSSDDAQAVEALLSPASDETVACNSGTESTVSSSTVQSDSDTPTKKRKRVFMDAVVVPTMEQVLRQRQVVCASQGRELKRTRSQTRLSTIGLVNSSYAPTDIIRRKPASKAANSPRKVAMRSGAAAVGSLCKLSSSDDTDAPGSDDSFGPRGYTSASATSSSDDDFPLGQVTPHHLVSPVLRRSTLDTRDPPSDDSTMADSPTREHVRRRLERTNSGSFTSQRGACLLESEGTFKRSLCS